MGTNSEDNTIGGDCAWILVDSSEIMHVNK